MTILVVDDEARLVRLLTTMLESSGHRVVGAERWDAALAPGPYDAALVDLWVGGTDGRDIADQLVQAGLCRSRVAVMTGDHSAEAGPYRLFPKPFALAHVMSWLASRASE